MWTRKPNGENYIKMDVKTVGSEGVDWNHLAQKQVALRAFVNSLMNYRVLYRMGKVP